MCSVGCFVNMVLRDDVITICCSVLLLHIQDDVNPNLYILAGNDQPPYQFIRLSLFHMIQSKDSHAGFATAFA